MGTVTFVNIKVHPYSESLKLTSTNGAATTGNAAWLDKTYADKLLAMAKKEKSDIYLESTMRSPETNNAKGWGSSHNTGKSTDLAAVIPKGTRYSDYKGDKRATVVKTIAKYGHGEQPLVSSGASLYPIGTQGKLSIYNSDQEKVETAALKGTRYYKTEWMHMQDKSLETDGFNKRKATTAAIVANSDADANGYWIDPGGNPRDKVATMTFTTNDQGYVVEGAKPTYLFEDDLKDKSIAAGAVTITDDNIVKDIDIQTSKIEVSDGDPYNQNVNVRNAGDTRDGVNTDTSFAGAANARYIKKTNYILPSDSRDVTASELSITASMEDKRVKNAIGCKNPYGTLEKYRDSEQPASLRLILDKLFASERDKAAEGAWKAFTEAKVTYIDQFIMERVSTQSKENYRVVASLGEEYKVYFGTAAPEVLTITGYTLNTQNQQWLYDFRYFYENYLKGSKLVKNRLRAFLTFTDSIFEVLPVSFSYSESAKIPGAVTLSIDCVVLQWTPFGDYTDPLTRNKTTKAAVAPIYSPSQIDFPDSTLEMLAKVKSGEGYTSGNTYDESYGKGWSQVAMMNTPNGKYRLPMYNNSTTGGNEAINLDAVAGDNVAARSGSSGTNLAAKIYAKEAKTVANAGTDSTTATTASGIIGLTGRSSVDTGLEALPAQAYTNNHNSGYGLAST